MPATDAEVEEEFIAWRNAVSQLCNDQFMLSLDDLPDMLTRDAFDAGISPKEFFDEEVMRMMREEFGHAVDEL